MIVFTIITPIQNQKFRSIHFIPFQAQSIEKLMKKLVSLYETKEDDASRSAIALVLKSVAKAKIEHIKDNEALLAPAVFLAMHAPKDDGKLIL